MNVREGPTPPKQVGLNKASLFETFDPTLLPIMTCFYKLTSQASGFLLSGLTDIITSYFAEFNSVDSAADNKNCHQSTEPKQFYI